MGRNLHMGRPVRFLNVTGLNLTPQESGFIYFSIDEILRNKTMSMHVISEPNILYFGTPVILIGTSNEDGSYNLAPMSNAFLR